MKLGIKRIDLGLPLPEFKTSEAACFDLCVSENTILWPFCGKLVKSGIILDTPKGHAVEVYLRSSMCKRGIHGSTGVIDSDFRGEICVQATSVRPWPILIFLKRSDRIGQARLVRLQETEIVEVNTVRVTERGTNGWGSTGR